MSETKYSWDWQPSSREEAEQWLEITDHFKRANIAKSRFADEAIIRAIATHAWKWGYNDKENLFLPALLENPNLTPELLSWLDDQTRTWGSSAQHSYWLKRYEIQANSNYDDTSSKKGRVGAFSAGLLTENLDLHSAAKSIFEMADHFAEQMWHDLTVQKHLELNYQNDYVDFLLPTELFGADEELLKRFSPGYFITWAAKEEELDLVYAQDRATDEGAENFDDGIFMDYMDEIAFAPQNLGFAIGAGLQNKDLEVLGREIFEYYLDCIFGDDREMYEVDLVINSDTPWSGIRYRELSEQRQMNLVVNFVNVLKHPYLGRTDGITYHLMHCMAKHDQTADNVKAFLRLNLPN